ncbi:hypothetical protein GGR52DRAFT_94371 [Hypoxylon sp. FL1284]|nr:hypothetical protein GGR52DRAFT_94371 [Hypoxylon sp. FL1284]
MDQEQDFFHQISDLREELSMIKLVLAEQEEVWKEYMGAMWPNQGFSQQQIRKPSSEDMEPIKIPRGFRTQEEWNEIWRPQILFNRYRRRIAKLEEDSERVERNILIKLDLKQKHAAMKEAHSAAILSAAVSGFTVVTVIFTPLSFVAALFALPIDRFNEGKDGRQQDGVYLSSYIGKWSGKLNDHIPNRGPLLTAFSGYRVCLNCCHSASNVGCATFSRSPCLGKERAASICHTKSR